MEPYFTEHILFEEEDFENNLFNLLREYEKYLGCMKFEFNLLNFLEWLKERKLNQ